MRRRTVFRAPRLYSPYPAPLALPIELLAIMGDLDRDAAAMGKSDGERK